MIKLLILLFPILVFAQSTTLSDIPLPKSYIQNLDPYECDTRCLELFLEKDMLFSFLAHANKKLDDKGLDEIRVLSVSILNLGAYNPCANLKIALILPYKKIGKYASSTTNAAFAYMMTKSHAFTLKSYKVESESKADLELALQQVKADGFSYVIAPFTIEGAQNIIEIDPNLNIYFPTINKDDISSQSPYLLFGGINYKTQSDILLKEAHAPLVIFSDKSFIGNRLASYQEERYSNPTPLNANSSLSIDDEVSVYQELTNQTQKRDTTTIKYFISSRTTNLERYLKENEKIVEASFFINTPIIKTGMIMSQLTLYDTNATNVLSTQINYNPLLLSMTQYIDRKNMVVANSITQENNVLIETNSLLGNDIVYDWINYTTTVGIDHIYNEITGEDKEYNIAQQDGQMLYEIELLRPALSKFVKYRPSLKQR